MNLCDTLPGYRRFHPVATDEALVRVFTSMTEEEFAWAFNVASARGISFRELIGQTARRADRWQDILLVETERS